MRSSAGAVSLAFGLGGFRARPGLRPAPALPLRSLHPQLVAVLGHAVRDPGDHNLGVIRRTDDKVCSAQRRARSPVHRCLSVRDDTISGKGYAPRLPSKEQRSGVPGENLLFFCSLDRSVTVSPARGGGLPRAPALPLRSPYPQLVAVLGHAVRDPGDHNLGGFLHNSTPIHLKWLKDLIKSLARRVAEHQTASES